MRQTRTIRVPSSESGFRTFTQAMERDLIAGRLKKVIQESDPDSKQEEPNTQDTEDKPWSTEPILPWDVTLSNDSVSESEPLPFQEEGERPQEVDLSDLDRPAVTSTGGSLTGYSLYDSFLGNRVIFNSDPFGARVTPVETSIGDSDSESKSIRRQEEIANYAVENDISLELAEEELISIAEEKLEFQRIRESEAKSEAKGKSGFLTMDQVRKQMEDSHSRRHPTTKVVKVGESDLPNSFVEQEKKIVKKPVSGAFGKGKIAYKHEYPEDGIIHPLGYLLSRKLVIEEDKYLRLYGIKSLFQKYPDTQFKEKEQPLNDSEECIILVSELADFYATEECENTIIGFNMKLHNKEYQESYKKNVKNILSYKRNKNG